MSFIIEILYVLFTISEMLNVIIWRPKILPLKIGYISEFSYYNSGYIIIFTQALKFLFIYD